MGLPINVDNTRRLTREPTYREFINHIIERPDDLATRLILADWLMEQDDALAQSRGRFIAGNVYTCNPHLMPGRRCFETGHRYWKALVSDPECAECQYRAWSESWLGGPGSGQDLWLASEGVYYDYMTTGFTYRNGFIEEMKCTSSRWHLNGHEIAQNNPIRKVKLRTNLARDFPVAQVMGYYSLCSQILSDVEKYEMDSHSLIVWAALFGSQAMSDKLTTQSERVLAVKKEARRRGFSLYLERLAGGPAGLAAPAAAAD